jgi:hypothetical protein
MDFEPVWGTPEKTQWSTNKTLAAVGVAVALAAVGGVVIYAADSGGANSAGPGGAGGAGAPWGRPGRTGAAGGPGRGPDAVPGALHGDFVVPDGNGGFATEVTQTGTVSDISDTAITAKSADGFTRTYVITTDTREGPSLNPGDTASIRARLTNGTATAVMIGPAP